jgi:PAS domain S-box-containing protein
VVRWFVSSSHDTDWIDRASASQPASAGVTWIDAGADFSAREAFATRSATALGVVVIGVAALSVTGWITGNETLKSIVPGLVPMKMNTAAGLIGAALSLILQSSRSAPRRRVGARAFAAIPTAIGVLTLCEHASGLDFGIDRLLVPAGALGEARTTPAGATCLTLVGVALFALTGSTRRAVRTVQVIALLLLAIALVTGVGYLYRTVDLFAPGPYRPMALHTSFSFAALASGILISREGLARAIIRSWPVRTKLVVLLLVISLAPFTLFAVLELRAAAAQLLQAEEATLAARSEQISADIDRFNEQNSELAELIARRAAAEGCCDSEDSVRLASLRAMLAAEKERSQALIAAALLDASGTVRASSLRWLEGRNYSHVPSVRAALAGAATSPEVRIEPFESHEEASVMYVARVRSERREPAGLAAVWTRASDLSRFLERANVEEARGFAVLFDRDGVRIAHTSSPSLLFHPAATLSDNAIALAAEARRFGSRTRASLAEVRAAPEMFSRVISDASGWGIFRAYTPATRDHHYAVGRRLNSAAWTVFYLVSESALRARLAPHTVNTILIAFLLSGMSALFGVFLTSATLRPLGALSKATAKLTHGELNARVEVTRGDELGQLAGDFNAMADRIESQAAALQRANQDLEARVQQRTAELVASEQHLRASESRYRELFENHPDMCATLDYSTGIILDCNQQLVEQLGYTKEELIGKSILSVYEHQESPTRDADSKALLTQGHVHDIERVLRRKDGRLIEASLSVSIVEDAKGGHIATAVFRDISDRKRAERDEQFMISRRSEERFRILLDGVKDYAIFLLDPQGYIKSWNAGAERIKGYTESEIIGKHLSLFYTEEDRKRGHVSEVLAIAEQTGKFAEEGWRVRKDGSRFWASVVVTPLYDARGKLEAFAKVTRDESERRRTDEALRQRQAELTASLREREVLLQEVHHRVKNNLQVVSSLLNMQMRQSTDEHAQSALAESRQRVAAIALIHEKLYQTKDYAGVPFSDYVRTLAADVFHAAGAAYGRVELEIDVESVTLAVDKAIPCGLILSELLSNTLKHAFPNEREGKVQVSLHRMSADLELVVADDGIGIPADFCVEDSQTLGMQLVTTLVEQLDGRLEIERHAGTAFKIQFPFDRAA